MKPAESIHPALFSRLVDDLYIEAMVMADEARSYFDSHSDGVRSDMDMLGRLSFTCESLKVTTRLMHIIAWLLTQRAWQRGEIGWEDLSDPKYVLGEAAPTDKAILLTLPNEARELVLGSQDLYNRVRRLQDRIESSADQTIGADEGPARALFNQLQQSI
jgi:regulator of CtrA degradation